MPSRPSERSRALDAVIDIARDRAARLGSAPTEDDAVIELGANRYGKAAIHLMRVDRNPAGHGIRDLTVAIALEGDFEGSYTDGDNSLVIATDTMKNTAYAFAKDHLDGSLEDYGRALAEHFVEYRQVDRATVSIRGHHWSAIDVAGSPARDAFVRGGEGTRVATVSATPGGTTVQAGIEDLVVLKTTRSGFSGFPRDRYTTLAETDDRLMATRLTAVWRYGSPDLDADLTYAAVRATLLEVFADHDSPSVQASIWIIGSRDPAAPRGGRRGPDGPAEPPSLAGRPGAVRADQRRRGVRVDDRAPRADRGDRATRRGRLSCRPASRSGAAPSRESDRVLTEPALAFVADLQRRFGGRSAGAAPPPRATTGRAGCRCPARLPRLDRETSARPTGPSRRRRPTSTIAGSRSPARPSPR